MKHQLFTILLLSSFSINASLVQGTSSGIFDNPIGKSELISSGDGTNHFAWGTPKVQNTNPSSLTYTGKKFNTNENEQFVFGNLRFFNGTIATNTNATEIDLNVAFNLSQPTSRTDNFSFHLNLVDTNNTSIFANNADYVYFDNTVASSVITSQGISYTLEFLGFQNFTENGYTEDGSFYVPENEFASADLVARITSTQLRTVDVSSVPVPAAFWLFCSALFGLIGIRRKIA